MEGDGTEIEGGGGGELNKNCVDVLDDSRSSSHCCYHDLSPLTANSLL